MFVDGCEGGLSLGSGSTFGGEKRVKMGEYTSGIAFEKKESSGLSLTFGGMIDS
jgi:hypothetical protein